MAVELLGKSVAEGILATVRADVEKTRQKLTLMGVILGENDASRIYLNNKKKTCEKVGILSETLALPEDLSEAGLLEEIKKLNENKDVTGVLLELPLPGHINQLNIFKALSPKKDVDGVNPYNAGLLSVGSDDALLPCTAYGIIRLIKAYGIGIKGKKCAVIGRSNIVGKPVANLLLRENGAVTILHSQVPDIAEITKTADIVVAAVGKAKFLTGDMLKPGCCVIDAGINVLDGVVCGDADFDSCAAVCSAITPVPGGIGRMTNAVLMENCVKAHKLQQEK